MLYNLIVFPTTLAVIIYGILSVAGVSWNELITLVL